MVYGVGDDKRYSERVVVLKTAERGRAFIGRDASVVVSHGTRNRGTRMDE